MRNRGKNLAEDTLCRHCYSAGKTGTPLPSPFPFPSAVVSQATLTKTLWQLHQNLVQDYTSISWGEQLPGYREENGFLWQIFAETEAGDAKKVDDIYFFFFSRKYRHFREALQKDEGFNSS